MDEVKALIGRVADGQRLSAADSAQAFGTLLSGAATQAQIGAFLMALRVRGETVAELSGAASALRSTMVRVSAPADAMDVVGTGGDNSGSVNVSTCAALVVAGAGIPVAKHGNRALSSSSGAADVFAELGVGIDLSPERIARCISEAGIGFMFAPAHHPTLLRVHAARKELGTRTIFNLLGPLLNPAGVRRHLVGVFDRRWVRPLAEVLGELGSARAFVVHGHDGLDEITTTGPTTIARLELGSVRTFELHPDDLGLPVVAPALLRGGLPRENAALLRAVLRGATGPYRDITVLNAAAALVVGEAAADLAEGVACARKSIDSGAALDRLDRLVEVSNDLQGVTHG